MLSDLRFALRGLRRNRTFALIAILTLALGIGANTAIFSVVNAVLLRPLPFEDAGRIVHLFHMWEGSREYMSPANVIDIRDQSTTLDGIAYFRDGSVTLTGRGDPARLSVTRVGEGFFDVLGVQPVIGRRLLPQDNAPGSHRVVMLSHALWQQRFGGAAEAIGSTVEVNGEPFEVVGVMPRGADYPAGTELWLPEPYDPQAIGGENRGMWYVSAIARLANGATGEQARQEVEAIGRRLEEAYPEANARVGVTTVPLSDVVVGDLRLPLLMLLGAVGMVLLIACANVANLLLARASARETELAVRTAVGAGRGRLTRQLLTESLVLATLGGITGLVLAWWGTRLLVALAPPDIPRLTEAVIDPAVLGFTALISVVTGVLFGLVPALQLSGGALLPALRSGGRGNVSASGTRRARNGFLVGQIAFSVVLLIGAGLLIRSFLNLQQVDPGFRSEGVLTFRVSLPASQYDSDEKRAAFVAGALERLSDTPGVNAAAAVQNLPMKGGGLSFTFDVAGRTPARAGEELGAAVRIATPDYFQTLGIPLLRGRGFSDQDHADAPVAMLISESAAQRYFPGEEALGQRIRLHWGDIGEATVVGVVGDVRHLGLTGTEEPVVYLAHAQRPLGSMDFVLRTSSPSEATIRHAAATITQLDPGLPVYDVRPLTRIVGDTIAPTRFYTSLLAVFGVVALLLAAIGIFGVVSYTVRQRSREFGLRMALGAEPERILGMVVRNAAILAGVGVILGAAGALLGARVLAGLLYGVGSADPATFLLVGALLLAVALCASALPARAATRVEPVAALRGE